MSSKYLSEDIEVLTGLEPVKRRPGMYTDTTRPNHLAMEVIDNSVDEALAGHARRVDVVSYDDGSVEVTDDGRGIAWEEVEALARQRGLSTGKSEVESHLFRPGFTTVSKVTEFSGTGEGLALVADAADKVGGSVEIRSARGRGTSVTLDLPRSLILQDVVIVAVGPVGAHGPRQRRLQFHVQGAEVTAEALAVTLGEPGLEERVAVLARDADAPVRDADPHFGLARLEFEVAEPRNAAMCMCKHTGTAPFCDGAHAGSGFSPLVFTVEATEKVALCQCKRTGNEPRCDGSHASL